MTILDEAKAAVTGPRMASYGHPKVDHDALGRTWAAILSKHLRAQVPDLPAHVVSMMMVACKVIREVGVHSHDNLVDIAGYAYCASLEVGEASDPGTGAQAEAPLSDRSRRVSDPSGHACHEERCDLLDVAEAERE